MTRNILITGTKGFVGSNLVKLAKDNKFNVTNFDPHTDFWDAKKYEQQFSKTTFNDKYDAVVHLGAIASTRVENEELLYGFNTHAVEIISKYCVTSNTPLIFISSSAVYGTGQGVVSMYSKTKQDAENILNQTPGLAFTIFRLFNSFGFNEMPKKEMKSVVSDMVISALLSKKIMIWQFSEIPFGEQSRDFIYIDDVCSSILSVILNRWFRCETYDLGSGRSHKFIDLANKIAGQLHKVDIIPIAPPENYNKANYQFYTKAKMEWLNSSPISHPSNDLSKIIPTLINQYQKILY